MNELTQNQGVIDAQEIILNKATTKNLEKNIGVFASFVLVVTHYWPDKSQD